MQEKEMQENTALDTAPAEQEQAKEQPTQNDANAPVVSEVKTFTQDQVNEIIKKRVERERASIYRKYGFADEKEIDTAVGRSQSYPVMKERYTKIKEDLANANKELCFLKNNISPERYSDIETHFKGLGLELNADNLLKELASHPEWIKAEPKKTTISVIGNTQKGKIVSQDNSDLAKVFGL